MNSASVCRLTTEKILTPLAVYRSEVCPRILFAAKLPINSAFFPFVLRPPWMAETLETQERFSVSLSKHS